MRRLSNFENPSKKVLVLGYDEMEAQIIKALVDKKCLVDHTNERVTGKGDYDFVVSFGYKHILTKKIIDTFKCPIFNLHISYLPYNRGAHPNFWSFYENTPSGVTIHLIDYGVDTGPIVCQKYLDFKFDEYTFVETYEVLLKEIEKLFFENLELFLTDNWSVSKQRGVGSFHKVKDLPKNFSGWHSNIKIEIERLNRQGLIYE